MSLELRFYIGAFVAFLILAISWLAAAPANAQMQPPDQRQVLCGPRRQVIDALKKQYGEEERWFGIATAKSPTVYLLMTSKEKSWTLLIVKPDVACAIGAGDGSTLLFGDPV